MVKKEPSHKIKNHQVPWSTSLLLMVIIPVAGYVVKRICSYIFHLVINLALQI